MKEMTKGRRTFSTPRAGHKWITSLGLQRAQLLRYRRKGLECGGESLRLGHGWCGTTTKGKASIIFQVTRHHHRLRHRRHRHHRLHRPSSRRVLALLSRQAAGDVALIVVGLNQPRGQSAARRAAAMLGAKVGCGRKRMLRTTATCTAQRHPLQPTLDRSAAPNHRSNST